MARELYQTVRHPSIKEYKNIIIVNAINNCTITIADIDICEKILGPDIYKSKLIKVRTKPKMVVNDYIEILQ